MIRVYLFLFSIFLSAPINVIAQDSATDLGSLMIVSPPGYRVYINGDLNGFTSDEQDGILLRNLKSRRYSVELRKGAKTHFQTFINIEPDEITEVVFQPENNRSPSRVNRTLSIKTTGYYRVMISGSVNDRNGNFKSYTRGMKALAFKENGRFVLMEDNFGQQLSNVNSIRDHMLSFRYKHEVYTFSGDSYNYPVLSYWPGSYAISGNKLTLKYDEGTSTILTISDNESTTLKIGSGEYIWVTD